MTVGLKDGLNRSLSRFFYTDIGQKSVFFSAKGLEARGYGSDDGCRTKADA